MRSIIRREPVIVGFVRAAALLLATFGIDVDHSVLETAIDWGSVLLVLNEIRLARGRVRPLSR